ncbi:hypothetical protein JCM16303_001208 [Sporobolomyces ruberrimus]
MRSFTFASLGFTALFALPLAFADPTALPPHSIEPTPSSHLFPRGSGTVDTAVASLESSVLSLANSAQKAVKGQGVCSSNSTCAGFIHFAQICSQKGDSAAIAGCICSSTSLEVMNACTNCISSNSVKANANHFSMFCNTASSTLALLAASQTPTTLLPSTTPSPSSPSTHDDDQHSGVGRVGASSVLLGLLAMGSWLI